MTSTIDTELTTVLHEQMPLAHHHQILGVSADHDTVVMTGRWRPELCGLGGVLHGGSLMATADGAGATLAFVNLTPGTSTTTIESKTNFFRPVTEGSATATPTLVHKGRTTIVVQTDITNHRGDLVSRTVQTQAARPT